MSDTRSVPHDDVVADRRLDVLVIAKDGDGSALLPARPPVRPGRSPTRRRATRASWSTGSTRPSDDPDDVRRERRRHVDDQSRAPRCGSADDGRRRPADQRRPDRPAARRPRAVNPALAVTSTRSRRRRSSRGEIRVPRSWWWNWFEHQNLRDDRAEAFTSYLPAAPTSTATSLGPPRPARSSSRPPGPRRSTHPRCSAGARRPTPSSSTDAAVDRPVEPFGRLSRRPVRGRGGAASAADRGVALVERPADRAGSPSGRRWHLASNARALRWQASSTCSSTTTGVLGCATGRPCSSIVDGGLLG